MWAAALVSAAFTAGTEREALDRALTAIPARWKDPLEGTMRSAVSGFDGVRISELAERPVRLVTLPE